MMKKLRLVFMGTADFAVPSLKSLADNHEVIEVFTRPPRRQGRGMKVHPSPVHTVAENLGFTVLTPSTITADVVDALIARQADLLVVVAYGLILPEAVLFAAHGGAVNAHPSLLPRWRGAAPIERAIEAGDTETGVSIIMLDTSLDGGRIAAASAPIPITADDTASSLTDRLAEESAAMLLEVIPHIADGTARMMPQDDEAATYAHKITDDEAALDFILPVAVLLNKIRAFTPRPGAWFIIPDAKGLASRIGVLAATRAEGRGHAGQYLGKGKAGGPVIATSDSALEITALKPAGKQVMSGKDFLNGYAMPQVVQMGKNKG